MRRPANLLMEEVLRAQLAAAKQARWLEENAKAISAHNQRVTKKGMFSDHRRRF